MGVITANKETYSVQEDAASFDPSSPNGGVGQLTYTIREFENSHLMLDTPVTLEDKGRGRFEATIRGLSDNDGTLQVTADGALSALNEWHTIPPYLGTLSGYVNFLASLTGITAGITVDPEIAATGVSVTGYRGNVWDQFRLFLSANQWEVSQVFSRIVVRPMRQIVAYDKNIITESRNLNIQTPSPRFDVNWYEGSWGVQTEFYPQTSTDATILVVDANDSTVQEFTLDGSAESVNQPVVQDYVANRSYAGTNGVYSVAGNDGLPITAAQWRAMGGSLVVRITDDPRVLEVTLRGANIPNLSPFRIAMSAGASNQYNSLHITGTGLTWRKNSLSFMSGGDQANSESETGSEIDNPFIRTRGQAITAGLYAMKSLAGPVHTLSGSVVSLNQTNRVGEDIAATIGDFNGTYPAMPISGFNSLYAAQTIEQFNTYWESVNENQFSNQMFGQGVGARIVREKCIYRVVSTTTGPDVVNYEAVSDTTLGDFNDRFSGAVMADFNTHYSGQRLQDYNVTPLRR